MPVSFDRCETRPPHIDGILSGLDRYNPETTTVFQDYVSEQCDQKTFDCYANLALLKLYQFNPHLLHPETTTNILMKCLTVFPSPSFHLALSLLPPSTQPFVPSPPTPQTDLFESIQKLTRLNTLLESASYADFWSIFNGDDLYVDLAADVTGFEELVRIRIAIEVGKAFREIDLGVLGAWLDLKGEGLGKFVREVCGWEVVNAAAGSGAKTVKVPRNRENEAKSEVRGERVGMEMFGRVVRRGFEQPA
ncbi:MAG: hypothetical protein Q9160_000211 [Pyrenula sp. 1 TL-2023]